jgi:DNA-binding GntR family transcriptional regulator
VDVQQASDAVDPAFAPVHQQVYQTLRENLITGRFSPGEAISLRSISEMLDVGMMPAREAIRRLAAENALEIQQNRRVCVPRLTLPRFEELMLARVALEPICAARALPYVDAARLERMIAFDAEMNESYQSGSADAYMLTNYRFHFELYRAGGSEVLVPLLESIWVQFGPFMRTVYNLVEATNVIDKHTIAIDAIRRKDAEALKLAIHADILDSVYLLRQTLHDEA